VFRESQFPKHTEAIRINQKYYSGQQGSAVSTITGFWVDIKASGQPRTPREIGLPINPAEIITGEDQVVFRLLCTFSIIGMLLVGCDDQRCGSGRFKCAFIYDVSTNGKPIKHDFRNRAILLSDNTMARYDLFYQNLRIIDLFPIVENRETGDIAFYNFNINFRNYREPPLYPIPDSTNFILLLCQEACFMLDTAYNAIRSFGIDGGGKEKLINALSVDIDVDSIIYISDAGDSYIKCYDFDGNFVNYWYAGGHPVFLKIYNDNIYIVDSLTSSIKYYDKYGVPLGTLVDSGQFESVVAFGFAYANRFWVADLNGKRITFMDSEGREIEVKTDYCFENSNYEFSQIKSLEADGSILIVTDKESRRILDFSARTD
jgi:hypothetical protein